MNTMEINRDDLLLLAARNRADNIYAAVVAELPSFSDGEILMLTDGRLVGHKPSSEAHLGALGRREYDVAVIFLERGLDPVFGGVALDALVDPFEIAVEVAATGAPIHSVVNAMSFAFGLRGEHGWRMYREAAPSLAASVEKARSGDTAALQTVVPLLRAPSTTVAS